MLRDVHQRHATAEALHAAESLRADLELPCHGLNLKRYVTQVEKCLIRQALSRTDGVVAHAAKLLGLRRTTLVEKLRKYGSRHHGLMA